MNDYIYIENSSKGKIGISLEAISEVVTKCLKSLSSYADKKEDLKNNKLFVIHSPVQIEYKNEITHIKVYIDVPKKVSINEITLKLHTEISEKLSVTLGHIPFDIRVKIEETI